MLLDETQKYLVDNTSMVFGTDLFAGYQPDTPATCTTIYEYGGVSPEMTLASSNPAFEQPRVQIVNRSSDYQTARNNSETIYRLMLRVGNQTLIPSSSASGCRYLTYEPIQSPFSLGRDENDNFNIVCNYQVMKNLST